MFLGHSVYAFQVSIVFGNFGASPQASKPDISDVNFLVSDIRLVFPLREGKNFKKI